MMHTDNYVVQRVKVLFIRSRVAPESRRGLDKSRMFGANVEETAQLNLIIGGPLKMPSEKGPTIRMCQAYENRSLYSPSEGVEDLDCLL